MLTNAIKHHLHESYLACFYCKSQIMQNYKIQTANKQTLTTNHRHTNKRRVTGSFARGLSLVCSCKPQHGQRQCHINRLEFFELLYQFVRFVALIPRWISIICHRLDVSIYNKDTWCFLNFLQFMQSIITFLIFYYCSFLQKHS